MRGLGFYPEGEEEGEALTKRQRLRRDPMNQPRHKVRAWAKKYGAIVDNYSGMGKNLVKTPYLMLHGFRDGKRHPNPRNHSNRKRAHV